MRRAVAIAAAGLVTALSAHTRAAPCGPTFCPSYTTCRVLPVEKPNPPFAELSGLFDKIAPGPSKYGSLGWSYSLMLNDGAGKPKPKEPVPARYPCSLLKAISVHESVGWHQFCVPTGPTCTGVSQTIISFDCGYGLMQVTSGMRKGETSAYDPNLVASDAAYNVSVGSRILGTKWTVTPSVGDNRVDAIEDWYLAVWAYNGLAFKNNPNNPAYPADRKPYRDPGGLPAGEYPYQEIIWGYVRTPYGSPPAYKAFPLSYPNKAEICASCGSPSASISDPVPIHWTDCPDSGVVPKPSPVFELRAEAAGTDRFSDGKSKGVVDELEGDEWVTDLYVKNAGSVAAKGAVLAVQIGEPWLHALHWDIESDAGSPGSFKPNDANDRPDQPPRDEPGAAPTFQMNAMAPGETKRVRLKTRGARYSIGEGAPFVRFWLKEVPDVYAKPDWDAKATDTSGAQTFNGGDLRVNASIDVYSRTQWTFDGGVLEGWTGGGAAEVSVREADRSLVVAARGDDPQAIGPVTAFDAAALPTVRVRGRSGLGAAPSRLYWATKDAPAFDETRAMDFDLSSGDASLDMRGAPGWVGTITRLRIDPAGSGNGEYVLDDVRVLGPGGSGAAPADGEDTGGCGCRVGGRARPVALALGLGALVAVAAALRRRPRRGR